ncbi:MAG: hypothetical protein ABL994_08885, partial [Verrucomicrobiales bacterium]
ASTRQESETRLRPIERFMWPLSAAVLALILSHLLPLLWLKPRAGRAGASALRTGLSASVLLVLSGFGPVRAKDAIVDGHAALLQKDYSGALESFESRLGDRLTAHDRSRLQMGIGAAAYRMEDFERAAEAFGQALVEGENEIREQAHYNLGNTLYRRGESALKPLKAPADPDQVQALSAPGSAYETTLRDWEGSIEHFETALNLDPANEMVAHNLEIVKKRLEELKKQKEEEEKKKEQEEEKKDEEKKEEDKEEDKEKDKEKDKDQDKNQDEKKDDPKDQNQDKQPEDGKQDPSENKDDKKEGKDPGKQPDGGDKKPEDPPADEPPGDPGKDDGKKPEDEGKNPDENGKPDDKESPGEKPPGGQGENPPKEPDAPQEGELQANPDQSQPQKPNQAGNASPGEAKTNPQTGYSPTEARQLLDALADETEVRPILQPSRGEKFKNW